MKQKIVLEHRDANQLANLGKAILSKFSKQIGDEVNFDPGSPGDMETLSPARIASLQFVCPNDLSGEIIMLCIRLPGVKMDLKPLDV